MAEITVYWSRLNHANVETAARRHEIWYKLGGPPMLMGVFDSKAKALKCCMECKVRLDEQVTELAQHGLEMNLASSFTPTANLPLRPSQYLVFVYHDRVGCVQNTHVAAKSDVSPHIDYRLHGNLSVAQEFSSMQKAMYVPAAAPPHHPRSP